MKGLFVTILWSWLTLTKSNTHHNASILYHFCSLKNLVQIQDMILGYSYYNFSDKATITCRCIPVSGPKIFILQCGWAVFIVSYIKNFELSNNLIEHLIFAKAELHVHVSFCWIGNKLNIVKWSEQEQNWDE